MSATTAPTRAAFRFPGMRKFEHSLLVYRRIWRGTFFGTLISPVLYLTAMGVALGSLVPTLTTFGGVPYIVFLAPGLVAGQAMQTATQESSWPLFAGFKWNKTFEAMIGTPQGVRDIVLGHLYWLVVRIGIVTAVFLTVAFLFGAITSATAILAWPAAILTGVAFGMPMAAWTASRKTEQSFAFVFRFIITPLFLFSGTFFPIEQLPDQIEWLAWLTPLFHGVALTRSLAIGHDLDPLVLGIHVLVLVGFAAAGTLIAFRTFKKRLVV
ncbi:MAG: ABC transporter permease [Candidatus Limnocylindrales bacterium]